ncbi:putative ferric-chelate reductase 1 [Mastacembelus armatus]|uniref:putative ferric-chelate reductase 1 n=1 Tax=Mastacembelus armatus TaxID=205130 RepID=UPI000E45B6EA|nr:putative ferric-chelate reductase 1 [Mastacembelus armatus]
MNHIILLLVCVPPVVLCYKTGLVTQSCGDMQPRHSVSPQTTAAPFTITTDRSSYGPGGEIKVHLQAQGSTPFTGFLLQAREVGAQSPVGSFTLTPTGAQFLTCSQKPNSAVSHTNASPKTSIQVTWRSDASRDGKPIQFRASFVQNYKTFWVDVTSPTLSFIDDTAGGSTSLPTTTTTSKVQKKSVTISSADCGVTKVCISKPSSCDPAVSADCYFMSAMMLSPNDSAIHYEMTGPSDGYVSFGFSDDQEMGNDDIYICGTGGDGQVWLQHAFSRGKNAPDILTLGSVSDLTTSVQDKVISCSFISRNTISTQRTTSINSNYYLLFAYGSTSNGQIQIHKDTFISANKIDINTPSTAKEAKLPEILKAHGALMLIAWMTTGSLGMIVARYLKGMAKGHKLFGKDVWFLVHVAVMSVTVAATIIAFILAFSFAKEWSGGAHPVLGCLVMILSLLQPIVALLRCGPQHSLRFLFNWSHALNAVAIKALAVAAIFTGLNLIDSSTNQWLMKVMGGLIGWEALFYIFLEGHWKCKVNHTDTSEKTMGSLDASLMALFSMGNLAFLVALLVGIGKA